MDFSTIDNTAEFTAAAALDATTPRFLHIAGDTCSARGLAEVARDVTGDKFGLLRGGSLGTLAMLIKTMQFFISGKDDVYPPWQGMQYMHNMYSGVARVSTFDNNRYPDIHWTTVKDVLTAHQSQNGTHG